MTLHATPTRTDRRIDAVIFDLDDTLITWANATLPWRESTRPHMTRVHQFLTGAGHTLPDQEEFFDLVRDHLRTSWKNARETHRAPGLGTVLTGALADAGLDLATFDIDDVLRAYDWGPIPGVQPYPDTHALLDDLRAAGYKIGLITNSAMPMWMRDSELTAFGLMPYLDARITSGDTGYIKPHPIIYRRMLDMLDTTAERAVFVGDNPEHDIAGANNAGLTSVWIDAPHQDRSLDNIVPDFTITSPGALWPILQQLEAVPEATS